MFNFSIREDGKLKVKTTFARIEIRAVVVGIWKSDPITLSIELSERNNANNKQTVSI